MTTGAKILLGSALAAVLYYARNIKKTADLIPSIVGAKIHQAINWSTLSTVLKFNVSLRNPGNTSVTVTGVVGNVYSGNTQLASFTWNGSVTIPGDNSTKTVNGIKVEVPVVGALSAVLNGGVQKLTAKGHIITNGNKIPFDTSFNVSMQA